MITQTIIISLCARILGQGKPLSSPSLWDGNFSDYKDVIPHLFHHNTFIVLGNGVDAKISSLSSKYEQFNDWKRLAESDPGVVDMETLIKGVHTKQDFLDLYEIFIIFDESTGGLIKTVAH